MGIFDQNDLQWGMLSNQSAPVLDAIGGLADMAGVSKTARARQEADQIFGGGQQGGLFGQKQPVIKPREINDIGTGELLRIYRNEAASPADREFAGTLLKQRLEPKKFDFLTVGKSVLRTDPTTGQLDQIYTVPDVPMSELDRARLEQEKVQTELYRKQTELTDRRSPDEYARREEVLRQRGIDPNSPEGQSFVLYNQPLQKTDGSGRVSATELKGRWEAENRVPMLDSMQSRIAEAKALNEKRFQGLGSQSGAWVSNQPAFNWLQTDAQRAAGQAAARYQTIMSQEAIAQMSEQLKGATTEFEMQRFLQIIADPNTSRENAAKALDSLERLVELEKRITFQRLDELGSNVPGMLQRDGLPAQGQPQPGRARILSVEPAQ